MAMSLDLLSTSWGKKISLFGDFFVTLAAGLWKHVKGDLSCIPKSKQEIEQEPSLIEYLPPPPGANLQSDRGNHDDNFHREHCTAVYHNFKSQ